MKFHTHNHGSVNVNFTSLQGYITATRAQLEATFGEPQSFDGENRVTTHWAIQFADETVATIYDWNRKKPEANEVCQWNIGAHARDTVVTVHETFRARFGLLARSAA